MGMPRLEPGCALQPRRCQHRGAWFPLCPVPRTVPNQSRSAPAPSRVPRGRSTSRLRIHPGLRAVQGGQGKSVSPAVLVVAQGRGSGSPSWLMAGPGPSGQGRCGCDAVGCGGGTALKCGSAARTCRGVALPGWREGLSIPAPAPLEPPRNPLSI